MVVSVPTRITSNIEKGDKNSVSLALDSLRDWVYEPAVGQERSDRAQAAVALLQPYIEGSGAGGDIASFESWTTNLSSLMVDLRRPISQNTANEGTDGSGGSTVGQRLAEGNRDAATGGGYESPAGATLEDRNDPNEQGPRRVATPGNQTSAGSQGSGAAGGGTASPASSTGGAAPSTTGTEGDGTLRQVPGGGKLWQVGSTFYLAYKIPGTNTPLVWQVEDADRLDAIFGTATPPVDRTLTEAQFKALSPWKGGLSAEIQNTDEHPWQVFMSKFEEQAELRPWLRDPTVQAVMGVAYLEGRAPTSDELSVTDWWNDHTEDERAWMESSVTAGREEVARRMEDAKQAVADVLRERGTSNAPDAVVEYIAMQRLTGKWSQEKAEAQIRKLTDPEAPGVLDAGVWAAWRGDVGNGGDARAVAEGKTAVASRVRQIFQNASVSIGTESEAEEARLARITDEVMSGKRTLDDVRRSVDIIRAQTGVGLPDVDVTRENEDVVKEMAARWLGPTMGQMSDEQVREWAGRIRNDPDAQQEFTEFLQAQRLALLPGYTDRNLTYEAIIQPVRNLAANVWGQAVQDDALLVDLANTMDYTEMAKRLRTEGRQRGVSKVVDDSLAAIGASPVGEQVVRSAI